MFLLTYNIKDLKVGSQIMCKDFKMVHTEDKTRLYNSQCWSLYGCELWNVEYPKLVQLELEWALIMQNDFKFSSSYTRYTVATGKGHKSH